MVQPQPENTESPYTKVIAESLLSGRSIDKKDVDFSIMPHEEYKRFMAELRKPEEDNFWIATANSMVEHKPEIPAPENHQFSNFSSGQWQQLLPSVNDRDRVPTPPVELLHATQPVQ